METQAPAARLARWRTEGTIRDSALRLFDELAPIAPEAMLGRWRGGPLHTGHPLDGLLERHGWYGKAFHALDQVDPLLFDGPKGPIAIDPRWAPLGMLHWDMARGRLAQHAFRLVRPLLATRKPAARLRPIQWNDQVTAAMVYDRRPIIDLFKHAAPGLILGMMDLRDAPPFFFTLERD